MIAFTPLDSTRSQLAMSWGVETFKTVEVEHTDMMVRQVDEAAAADRTRRRGRHRGSSSPAARPASPARPTRCASTRWATPSTRSRPAYTQRASRRPGCRQSRTLTGPIQRRRASATPGRRLVEAADVGRTRHRDRVDARHGSSAARGGRGRRVQMPMMSSLLVDELPARVVVALRDPPRPCRVAQLLTRRAVGVEQPAQQVGRVVVDDRRCQGSRRIGRSCLRPGPCCGNRHVFKLARAHRSGC